VNIIKISSVFDQWWKAEDMKKILWHVMPIMCLAGTEQVLKEIQLSGHILGKNRLDTSIWTNFRKLWWGQEQSGQIGPTSVQMKGTFSGSGLPYHCPGSFEDPFWASKAHEGGDMSQYFLHILSLSLLIKTRRYFYYIHNWSHSQMVKLLKKKFWISSSFPHCYYPWIIYYFIPDLFSTSSVNK